MDREVVMRMAWECELVTSGVTGGMYVEALERFAAAIRKQALIEASVVAVGLETNDNTFTVSEKIRRMAEGEL